MIRQNKYNNKKCKCLLGHQHDSKLEATHCNRLLSLRQAGRIKAFIVKPIYNFVLNGVVVCKHIPDFKILANDDRFVIHDTKGVITQISSLKRKLFIALYPDTKYKIIKKGVPTREDMGL